MRPAMLLIAPLLPAATVPPPAAAPAEIRTPELAQPGRNCGGRMETARQDNGTAKVQRDDAESAQPVKILAVDRRIDGCEVLVTGLHAGDIRPLPQFQDGPSRMRPLR